MIISGPTPTGVDPALWEQLQAKVKTAHDNGIRAKSAVKRLTEDLAAIEALTAQIRGTA